MLCYGINRSVQMEWKRTTNIKKASRYLQIADCGDFMIRPNAECGPTADRYHTTYYPDSCGAQGSTYYWYELRFRHNGKVCTSFWDGHAEALKRVCQDQLYVDYR